MKNTKYETSMIYECNNCKNIFLSLIELKEKKQCKDCGGYYSIVGWKTDLRTEDEKDRRSKRKWL